jgi:large repetitive protein
MIFWANAGEDIDNPVAICKDIQVSLDEYGYVNIAPEDINDNSYDEGSGIETMLLSVGELSCENIWEPVIVTLTVSDYSGNSDECQANVTVIDDLDPVEVYCQNIEIEITSAGYASLEAWELELGSSDNCGIDHVEASQTEFGCEYLGENTVEVTFYDFSGNTASCQSTVTVVDNTSAEAVCLYGSITRYLDNGSASISLLDINDNYSSCNITSSSLSQTEFTCADVGLVEVVLTVIDLNSSETSCTTDVYIEEPEDGLTAACKNTSVQLVEGTGSIVFEDVDDGSTSACGFTSGLSQSSFTVDDIGENVVTVTIYDQSVTRILAAQLLQYWVKILNLLTVK